MDLPTIELEQPVDFDRLIPITVTSVEELTEVLQRNGIPLEQYNTGSAKGVDSLWWEIKKGESALFLTQDRRILRKLSSLGVDVYYDDNGRVLRLREDYQKFADGRERRRGYKEAVSEKMKPDEEVFTAATRALEEELGIQGPFDLMPEEPYNHTYPSTTYPGLLTNCRVHPNKAQLNNAQFKPEGYIEIQHGLTTYFVWEETPPQEVVDS